MMASAAKGFAAASFGSGSRQARHAEATMSQIIAWNLGTSLSSSADSGKIDPPVFTMNSDSSIGSPASG